MFLEECVDEINRKLKTLKGCKSILIWGAGENAVRLFQYTQLALYNISCIIDKKLYDQSFMGKTVMKPEDVIWENIDAVIITVYAGAEDIKVDLLTKFGFKGPMIALLDGFNIPFYRLISKKFIMPAEHSDILTLQKNNKYKNIHRDERVFILCTGPSINEMDLIRLKNEKVIAVNSFYLHKDCSLILPDYYCVPTIGHFFDSDVELKFLKEIQQSSPDTSYFFSIEDKSVIEKMKEYEGRCVNYVSFSSIPDYDNLDIDLCTRVMIPQSVSIMALEIAVYMGFQEIYLLGTEHDNMVTGKYKHFYDYDASVISKAGEYEDAQGDDGMPFDLSLESIYNLWNQYKILKKIAKRKGIAIYNATKGGILDVFERVDFDTLF